MRSGLASDFTQTPDLQKKKEDNYDKPYEKTA
jgi:hypothetical protein